MDVVGVMAAYLPVMRVCVYCTVWRGTVCVLHCLECLCRQDRPIAVILAKYCIELPDGGSFVIRNMLEQF